MDKLRFFMFAILMTVSVFSYGENFEVDGIRYNILSKTAYTCEVTYKQSTTNCGYTFSDVVIPARVSYNGSEYTVTKLGYSCFRGNSQLKSISMPNTITSLESGCFSNCVLLDKIVVPSGVTNLSGNCFSGCVSLSDINLANVAKIGDDAFNGCVSLRELFIPNSVTEISYDAFTGCTSLANVTFEDGKEPLSAGYDYGRICEDSPLDSVYLGRNLSVRTFFQNKTLRSVYISDAVTSIYQQSFAHCANLQHVYGMGNVQSVGSEAFSYCSKLKTLVIPNNVTSIGKDVTYGGDTKDMVAFGDGITDIADQHIRAKNLYLGSGLKTIGYNSVSSVGKIYLFSDVLTTLTSNAIPTKTDAVYVANPERYETLLGTFNLKPLLMFYETPIEYTGKMPDLSYKNNVDSMDVSFDSGSMPKDAGIFNTELGVTFSATNCDWSTKVKIPCSYTIEKAPLSIKVNNVQRYYGEENPDLTYEFLGFKNGETSEILVAQPVIYTTATKESPVGIYPIYCTGAEAKNYSIDMQSGALTILKAPQTITWDQDFSNVTVGDQIELTATCSSGLSVKYRSSDPSVALIVTKDGKQNAYIVKDGFAAITAYQGGNSNYEEADELTYLVNATTTGISCAKDSLDAECTYYNMSGQRIEKPVNGKVFFRKAAGNRVVIIQR